MIINKNNLYLLQNNSKIHMYQQFYISFKIILNNRFLAFNIRLTLSEINFL